MLKKISRILVNRRTIQFLILKQEKQLRYHYNVDIYLQIFELRI